MHSCSVMSRKWKTIAKLVFSVMIVLLVFFVSVNNVQGEITIRKGSLLNLSLGQHSERLRLNQFYTFTATAFRTNPHFFLKTPDVKVGNAPVTDGIKPSPKLGYIEFFAEGAEKKRLANPKKDCGFLGRHCITGSLTHSMEYKWKTPGPWTVTARVYDEDETLRGTVSWTGRVGELTFEALPDLLENPTIPKPPSVEVNPSENPNSLPYSLRVDSDMTFDVRATSDDGIAAIEFVLEGVRSRQLIDKKEFGRLGDKKLLSYWPSFTVEHTWKTIGNFRMVAIVTTKKGGSRLITWKIHVKAANQPPTKIGGEAVVNLGDLSVGDSPKRVNVSEYFSDPEGDSVTFDEVELFSETSSIITLTLLGSKRTIEIEPERPGKALFYAVARERDGLTATQTFTITVTADENRAPTAVGTIPAQTLTDGDSSTPLDISTYFRDPDGDTLTYTVDSSDRNIALEQVIGSQLTISPFNAGNTTVTVKATDPKGLSADQTFSVTVTDLPLQNTAPETVSTIPTQSLTDGDSAAPLDISTYFRDPDGDTLTYTAWTDTPRVIKLQRVGSRLTLTSKIAGTATVFVRGTDPGGLSATQRFTVTVTTAPVQNRAPRVSSQIPAHALTVGNSAALLPVSSYFNDPDGDTLTYTSSTSNTSVVTASTSGSPVLITPVTAGTATITVTASDGKLTATQSFTVTVTDPPVQNRAPRVSSQISAHALTVGNSAARLPVSSYFNDPDGDTLTYTSSTSNTSVVTVSRSGSPVLITPVGAGTATITVTASDEKLTATQSFTVTITGSSQQNQAPEVIHSFNRQNFRVDDAPKWRNLSSYFSDPDDDTLTYTATSSNTGIVAAIISGNSVKITPGKPGTARVTVTARDTGGLTVKQSFTVTVQAQLQTVPNLPVCDRTPQIRDEIMKRTRDNNCANVTEDELESITRLSLSAEGLTTLKQGDFDELRNLEDLVLNENSLRTLPEDVFWYLRELEYLGLKNNQFTTLVADTFEHLDSLTDLTLYRNQITTLQEGAFNDLDNLIELDLRENQLTTLPAGVFEDLSNLEDLYLEDNRIAILSRGGFLGLSSLTDLELDGNPIHTIRAGAFNGLSSLTDLDFNGYPLRKIEAGAFSGLSSLTDLDLDDTQLSILPRNVFLGLSSLEDLYLDGNPIQTIEVGAFSGLSSLTDLDLGDAQLRTLARNVFSGLSNLTNLDLDGNPIQTIEVGAFSGLSSLTDLDLGDAQLSTLRQDVFSGLSNLTNLDLDGNPLRAIEVGAFNGLSNLISLSLDENRLTTLPVGIFSGFSRLERLDLRDNPGAPFTLTLELARTDNTNLKAAGPATVKVKLAEGTPFDMNIRLSVEGGTLSADIATLTAGQIESNPITVSQTGTALTTVRLRSVPTLPQGYLGIQMAVGTPLVLFSEQLNRPPVAVGTIPTQTLTVGDAAIVVNVSDKFNDADGDSLHYTASSDNTNVVSATMSGPQVTLVPKRAGNASVTVTASDGALTATQTLSVSVVAAPTENEAPVAIGVIPAQSLTLDGASSTVDISAYFSDANGDMLTYTAWPNDKNVVRLQRKNALLTIIPKAAGLATVTVKATDPDGLEARQRISVFVSTTEVPVTELPAKAWMPDANLRAAVRNALDLKPNDPLTQQTILALTSLRHLGPDLNDNQKIADLTGLEYALNLEHLDLYAHLISTLRPLAGLAKLRRLWLAGNRITNIRPLTNLPLAALDLGGNPINDFAPLAELTGLTRLDFWGNGLDNSDLDLLTGLTQLTQLDLRNNQISDIASLTQLVKLKKLQLEGNPITDTSALLNLTSQNPDLEIDIEIGEGPPSQPDTEIEGEVPDLVVESVRVNKTTVDPGDVFRLDAVIKNQGKATSGAAKVHFYRSPDETITTDDTKVQTSDMPSLAADRTKNRWARLTAPKTAGVHYYGVCIDNVENEGNTQNNCSTAIKITVETSVAEPSVVVDGAVVFPDANLAKKVREALNLPAGAAIPKAKLSTLPFLHASWSRDAAVENKIKDITGLEHATQLTNLSLWGHEIRDITPLRNLTALTRLTLFGSPVSDITPLQNLTALTDLTIGDKIVDITPLQNLTALTRLVLIGQIHDITPLRNLTALTHLNLSPHKNFRGDRYDHYDHQISDITPLQNLTALRYLSVGDKIVDITPLQNLTSLTRLNLRGPISDITPLRNLTALTDLELISNQINDITPLRNLTALTRLLLSCNQISDITPLQNLTALTSLGLYDRPPIRDITPLQNLTALTFLALFGSPVSDITPLRNLTAFKELSLRYNQITDVSSLENLTSLTYLALEGNPIADLAPLRRLKAKNPSVRIDIDIGGAPSIPIFPDETALLSNYPNPSNPETWIPYQLAEATDVTLTIYDVRGVMVRRLALGHQPAGFYHGRGRAAHWDGRNQLGEKVASGLYFYTFTAGEFTATRRMLILK